MIPIFQYAHGGIYEEYLELAKTSALDGFTVAGEYHQGYRTPRMQRFRAAMEENGVGAMLESCGYVYSHLYTGIPATNVKKQSDIRSLLTVYLNNFKDDPNVWVYRTFDEQNAVNYGEELRWQNDIMGSLDPDHPTMGVTDRTFATRPGVYAKTADIIGVDPYYCTGAEDQNLAGVGDMIAQFRELNPNRPVFATLQGFWYKNRGDLRGPTEQEYRNMVWQALCEGVVAIDTYSYTDMKANPWSGKTYEELWDEQATVLGEVEEFEQILLSTLPAPYYETDAVGVRLMSRRYNGKSYLFAVNTDNSAKTVKVKMGTGLSATEYYTDAQLIADSEGYFTLNMDSYGVAILEIAQSDYLSPNAKLIRFGVEGAPITNADSEIPDIIIDSSVTELSYRAETSDYAQVYINGVPVQNVGKINVEGASSLMVEVVSQDGKHMTEKKFNILYSDMPRVALCDFDTYDSNNATVCGDFTQSYSPGLWTIQNLGGVADSPCVKLSLSESVASSRYQLVYKAEDAAPGDSYLLRFRVKGENLTSDSKVRPYIEFAGSDGKSIGSAYGQKVSYEAANVGWVYCSVISTISSIAAASDYYNIYVSAFLEGSSREGIAYIDDIAVLKVN